MGKYRQDAESLLPDVAPCGEDLLYPAFHQKKENPADSQKWGQPWGQCEYGMVSHWITKTDLFLVRRDTKSGTDTSLKPKKRFSCTKSSRSSSATVRTGRQNVYLLNPKTSQQCGLVCCFYSDSSGKQQMRVSAVPHFPFRFSWITNSLA